MKWLKQLPALLLLIALFGLSNYSLGASNFILVSLDSQAEGFNDTTPALPIGGNPGVTLGEQREIAFEYAIAMLEQVLSSTVPIRVQVDFKSLYCTSSAATLAAAGAYSWTANTAGVPANFTWYPYPLANSLAGSDLFPGAPDISVEINSNLYNNDNCLNNRSFYYGLDGNAGINIDFITTIMHELIHGLGFQTLVDLSTGDKGGSQNWNDAFMRNLEDHSLGLDWSSNSMNDGNRAASATDTGDLLWSGVQTTLNSSNLSNGTVNGQLSMYAPSTVSTGSSVNHIDTAASPDELMEPVQTGPRQSLGMATYMLQDLGWTTAVSYSPIISPASEISMQNTTSANVEFAVLDNDTDVSQLTVLASSSNTNIIANSNLTFSGDERLRNLTITPNPGASGSATITVIVDDGNQTAQTSFVANIVNNESPFVSISSPTDNTTIYSISQNLLASANDTEDGDISNNIAWTSSINGSLGSGASILTNLSEGTHTITATAMDSGNAETSQAISITVDLLGDSDGDGLNNSIEILLGTHPEIADTDDDGLSDFDEVNQDDNATNFTAGTDTDPNNPDTDGDGAPDGFDPEPLNAAVGGFNVPMIPTYTLALLALILIAVRRKSAH